jgi:hypothetical protein
MPEVNLPDLARDCVYATLNQSSRPVTLERIMEDRGMSAVDMLEAMRSKEFRMCLRAEKARARELGTRAGHVFRVEEIVTDLTEILYDRLRGDGVPVQELVKGFQVLSRMAGLDELPGREKERGNVSMAVQINVPPLANPKLAHLKGS